MEGKKLQKVFHTIQSKFKRKTKNNPSISEYAFSTEELDELNKNNIEKIKELKKNIITEEKEDILEELQDSILIEKKEPKEKEDIITNDNIQDEKILQEKSSNEDQTEETPKEEIITPEEQEPVQPKHSYINLTKEEQEIIMQKWEELDISSVDMDIINGKDLLNHNYTTSYTEDALKFIHEMRKKYEIVICYLIGFNNEKKGIEDKNYFSKKLEEEWKYLDHYIKLLEKIRNFKIHN